MLTRVDIKTNLSKDRLCLPLEEIQGIEGVSVRDDRYLVFGDSPHDSAFWFNIGLDLSTGTLYVGGVDDKVSPVRRIAGRIFLNELNIQFQDRIGRTHSPSPLFVIERSFYEPLLETEILRSYQYNSEVGVVEGPLLDSEHKGLMENFQIAYGLAVDRSATGKPCIESDYELQKRFNERLTGWNRPHLRKGPDFFRKTYGDEVYSAMIQLERATPVRRIRRHSSTPMALGL